MTGRVFGIGDAVDVVTDLPADAPGGPWSTCEEPGTIRGWYVDPSGQSFADVELLVPARTSGGAYASRILVDVAALRLIDTNTDGATASADTGHGR